jgi:hypothetical protein
VEWDEGEPNKVIMANVVSRRGKAEVKIWVREEWRTCLFVL